MCGIAGGYWPKFDPRSIMQIKSALYALRHRGPNHQGFERLAVKNGSVILGHSRLSVIDLSDSANQPMHTRDGRYSIVFNGEIYNYIELRSELQRKGVSFKTKSDTEVLLAAWSMWGSASLPKLLGMFAFVIVDKFENTIIAARDNFGIKPFYFSTDENGFRFASEQNALREMQNDKSQLNWQRAYDYLVHGEYDSGCDTFIKDVNILPPGHMLTVKLDELSKPYVSQWWAPSILKREIIPFDEAASELRKLLVESVRLHLRSDVPLGAALSGGLDSSTLVCIMRHLEPDAPIHTFSYIASDSTVSEELWVDRINAYVHAVPNKLQVTPDELADDLEDLIITQGEPFGGTSIYAQYRVFKLAKEHGMTVTLDGQGADELQGGYNAYPGERIRSLIENKKYNDAWTFFNEWSKWPGRSRVDAFKRLVQEYSSGTVYQALRELNGMKNVPEWLIKGPLLEEGVQLRYPQDRNKGNAEGRRMMARLAKSISQKGLPALLRHGDRNSMRFSIESRVPFLTPQLADFMLGLPEEYLVSINGESKNLLRASMKGIVPDDVLYRKDKIGFATPEKQWLLTMADTIRTWLEDELQLPFIDQKQMVKSFDEIVSGNAPFTPQVWRWINFCKWYSYTFK